MKIKKFISCFIVVLAFASLCYAYEDEGRKKSSVVTPYGYSDLAINYPGNVTVITRKDIEKSNAKYVYELLRKESGIHVYDYTHAGKTVAVDMRGCGEYASRNVLVMVDGRRINEIDISGPDWANIPIQNVERIEILRGAGSVLYGDNAAMGVINIITKKNAAGQHVKTGADFGSYRQESYYGNIFGREDFASYNFYYGQDKTDGYRLNGDYEGYNFLGDLSIMPADYLNVDFSGGYHKDWYGMPAGLQRTEIDQFGYKGSTTPNDVSKNENTYFMVAPKLNFSSDLMDHELYFNAWGRKERLDTTTWDHVWGGDQTWDNSQIDSKGGSIRYTNTLFWNDIVNKLTAGVDLFTALNRLLTVTPVWGTYNQLKIKKDTLGVYINDNVELFKNFIVNGGFRNEWAHYDFDQSENAGRYETKYPEEQAFDIGVEYKYTENGAVYARYTRSFRFPATDEFYSRWSGLNTSLEHQTSDIWELGVKDQNWPICQPFINTFWIFTDNEIFYDPTQGTFGDNRNYPRTRRFGVETGAVSEIEEWLEIFANYTFLDANYDGGTFASNRIPMVPEHKIACGFSFLPVDFLEFNYTSEYVTEQFSFNDEANKLAELKPYFVNNLKITGTYKWFKVFFGINNIFDARYSEIASSNTTGTATDYFPAPERNYIFGASAEF